MHSHSHDHRHHTHNHRDTISENLLKATVLNFTITVVEIAGGLLSHSFALLSDALHNFSDAIAVFLAYWSNKISKRSPTLEKTYGFKRIEIISAMLNALVLIVICIFLFIEAYKRLRNPEPINGALMVVVALVGLFANFIAVSFLRKDKEKNLNVKAAYMHLIGDTLSSITVVLGGLLIYYFKIYWLDPILTFIIGIFIFKETWQILKQAYLILLQATPPELDLEKLKNALEILPEIENIHHVHAWKLNDEQIHFECHVDLKRDYKISDTEEILYNIKKELNEHFGIYHSTIQFEYNCCNDKSIIYKAKHDK